MKRKMSLELAAENMGLPDERARVPYHVILSRLADIMNTALETGADDVDDAHDIARAITFRVLARADIERRSLHSFWHGHVTTGDEARHAAAPDVHERVRASVKVKRSNSGREDREVVRHGRAYVIGATDRRSSFIGPTLTGHETMSADRARFMLETTSPVTVGRDAVDIYRATQALYGHSIPDLIGADVLAFHEFRAWDDVRARTPRTGTGTRYRLATVRARSTDDVRPGELLAPHDGTVERSTVPATAVRDDEGRLIARTHERVRTTHVAPAKAWSGHRLIARGETVRDARAKRARGVDDALLIRATDDVAHVLSSVADSATGPYRATWALIDENSRETGTRGALTVTPKGTMNVTGIPGTRQVKARTVPALRKAIARAIAN